MQDHFKGESYNKVDAKGRVSIPAGFRRVLKDNDPGCNDETGPVVHLVYGTRHQKFIECFSARSMNDLNERIGLLRRGSVERRTLEWIYSGLTTTMRIDETGRLVLAPMLREKFGITDEAYFIASGDTFQIWNPATHRGVERSREAYLDRMYEEHGEEFDPLLLLDSGPRDG